MNDTKIYAAKVDFAITPETFAEWYSLLPAVRKAKVDYYSHRREKIVALSAGLLMRWCLEQRLHRSLKEDELALDEGGKPFLHGENGIHFNLSHAGDYVVCAVAGRDVGIDIEEIRTSDCEKVVRRVFSPVDYAEWAAQPAEEKLDYFYRLWTLMESFSKAVGLGFSLDSRKIRFSQVKEKPYLYKVYFTGRAKAEVWHCRQYHCCDGYKLALCMEEAVFPERVNMVHIKDLCNALEETH
jgi:4'-phosphopantetheinyl transferase